MPLHFQRAALVISTFAGMACYAGAMNAQTNKTFHHPSGEYCADSNTQLFAELCGHSLSFAQVHPRR